MEPPDPGAEPPAAGRSLVLRLLSWVLLVVGLLLFVRVLRRIDWAQVADALARVTWWQVLVLLVVCLVRLTVNAVPLTLLTPGLPLPRAVVNDLSASLVAAVAPPPADVVLRIAMLRSWGVDVAEGMAALTLNNVVYYVARFAAPVVGLGLLLVAGLEIDGRYGWTAAAGGAVAGAPILLALLIAVRPGDLPARLGLAAGRGARVFAKQVEPQAWAEWTTRFRDTAGRQLGYGAGGTAAATLGLLVAEVTLVTLSLRFVGLSSADASTIAIAAAFLCVYPITALPFHGIGVLDAAFVALLGDNVAETSEIVAGLVVWRIYLQLVPWALGGVSLVLWRRRTAPLVE